MRYHWYFLARCAIVATYFMVWLTLEIRVIIKGTIAYWNDAKGFGFIAPDAGGEQVFVHIKSFSFRTKRPDINQALSYTLSTDNKGRPCAMGVTLPGEAPAKVTPRNNVFERTFLVTCFMGYVGLLVWMDRVSFLLFGFYLLMSFFTFAVYAKDKLAAQKGGWRWPEGILHLLTLIGGWPGALVAQQTLHHKTKKKSFQFAFWMLLLVHCVIFLWLTSPSVITSFNTFIDNVK